MVISKNNTFRVLSDKILLPYILSEKYIYMEMTSPVNRHCANCIGTLSFPISDCSFQYASSRLWNQLPISLLQTRPNLSNSDSPRPIPISGTSVPSTHQSHHPSLPRCLIPGLKPSFSFHCSLLFLLQDWIHGFPGLFTNTSEHICFYFLVCLFSQFLVFSSVR